MSAIVDNDNIDAFTRAWHDLANKEPILAVSKHLLDISNDFCVDAGCTMSIVDRKYLTKCIPNANGPLRKTDSPIRVHAVGHMIHYVNEYLTLGLNIAAKDKDGSAVVARITREVHVVDNLTAKLLRGMNIVEYQRSFYSSHSQR